MMKSEGQILNHMSFYAIQDNEVTSGSTYQSNPSNQSMGFKARFQLELGDVRAAREPEAIEINSHVVLAR